MDCPFCGGRVVGGHVTYHDGGPGHVESVAEPAECLNGCNLANAHPLTVTTDIPDDLPDLSQTMDDPQMTEKPRPADPVTTFCQSGDFYAPAGVRRPKPAQTNNQQEQAQ